MPREPRGQNPAIVITHGEYKGWKAYGPYMNDPDGRKPYEFYRLKKGDEKKSITKEEFESLGLDRVVENNKPFLDFLSF